MMTIKLFIFAGILASAALPAVAADSCAVRSGTEVVPLVELYTSEGCSSCPPADRWLSQKFAGGKANFLAFHVDYWDDIGWPDRFASPLYSQRQRQRVAGVGDETVYTPQVMVGDDVRTAWQSQSGFARVLHAARTDAGAGLALRLHPQGDGLRVQLGAARSRDAATPAQVWLAQYVDGQATQVRAGENRGATLHHDRIVQHLWGPWRLEDAPLSRSQDLPRASGAWGLLAFVQDARGRTLQSLDLPAARCLAKTAAK